MTSDTKTDISGEPWNLWSDRVATLFRVHRHVSVICQVVTVTRFLTISLENSISYQDAAHFRKCGSNVTLSSSSLVSGGADPLLETGEVLPSDHCTRQVTLFRYLLRTMIWTQTKMPVPMQRSLWSKQTKLDSPEQTKIPKPLWDRVLWHPITDKQTKLVFWLIDTCVWH